MSASRVLSAPAISRVASGGKSVGVRSFAVRAALISSVFSLFTFVLLLKSPIAMTAAAAAQRLHAHPSRRLRVSAALCAERLHIRLRLPRKLR